MLRILKAELQYNIRGIAVLFSLCVLFFLGSVFWGKGYYIPIGENGRIGFGLGSALTGIAEIYNLMVNTSIAWFIAMAVMGASADKQKLDRFNSMLPLPRRIYGFARLLFVNASQVAIFVLWLLFILIRFSDFEATQLWVILSSNGLLLSLLTILVIHHDQGFFETKQYKRINYLLLLLLIIITNVILNVEFFKPLPNTILQFFISPLGAAFFTILWIGLSLLSAQIYTRRKIYLE